MLDRLLRLLICPLLLVCMNPFSARSMTHELPRVLLISRIGKTKPTLVGHPLSIAPKFDDFTRLGLPVNLIILVVVS